MIPKAYEGNEKYIFVSYAHSDRDEVFDVLRELEDRGYRFWYDDGIAPGSEWPEDIARHLNDSYVVMAFITPRSVASQNCRREINYALSKNKHFLSVLLEKTEMSAGLEMQLSAQQSVVRYNYGTREAFINKLLSSPYIEPCREIPEETAEEAPEENTEKIHEKVAGAENKAVQPEAEKQQPAVAAEPAAPEKKTAGRSQRTKQPKHKESREGSKGKRKTLITAACVALLVVLAIVIYKMSDTITTSWGDKYSKGDTWIDIENTTPTQKDIDKLAKVRQIRTLKISGCDLTGLDIRPLTEKLDEGAELSLSGCSGITDFSFLEPLDLCILRLDGLTELSDLSLVPVTELGILDISGTGVSNIDKLADAKELTNLNISNTAVTDIDPITGLEELEDLDVSGCSIKKPGDKLKSLSLQKLDISGCGLSDLSAFSNITIAEKLNISGNKVSDLSWFNEKNSSTLTEFYASETGLDTADFAFLKNCKALKKLVLDGTSLDNLDFLRGNSELEYLAAQGCGLTDISGLEKCTLLQTVLLSFNELEGIKGLSNLKPEQNNDIILDLSFNKLNDVSALPEGDYHTVLLAGNDAELASTISAGLGAYNISMDWYDGILKSSISGTEKMYHIYIIGVPESDILEVTEKLTNYSVHTLTADELYEDYLAEDALDYKTYSDFSYAVGLYKSRIKE